jgi:hypothetical protein
MIGSSGIVYWASVYYYITVDRVDTVDCTGTLCTLIFKTHAVYNHCYQHYHKSKVILKLGSVALLV